METQYTKLADDTMKVVKTLPTPPAPEPVTVMYSLDQLKTQELSILKSINDFNETQQTALTEVRELISQANALGIKTNVQIQAEQVIAEQVKLDANPVEVNPIDVINTIK